MFVNAVGMHPDRLTNMYFAYVFVLRAIGKARPLLMVRHLAAGMVEKKTFDASNELQVVFFVVFPLELLPSSFQRAGGYGTVRYGRVRYGAVVSSPSARAEASLVF